MIKVVFDHVVDLEDSGAAGDQATGGTGIDNAGGAVTTGVGVGKRPAQGDGGVERSNAGDQGGNAGGHAACFFGAAITMRGWPLRISILLVVAPLGG